MNSSEITYQNMVETLVRALPELKDRYDEEMKFIEEKDLTYMAYSLVFYRHIEALLKASEQDQTQLRNAFEFLEALLTHSDSRVRDVADQSVCENICSDEIVLQKAQSLMGPAAQKSCSDYMGHAPKTPRGP